MPANTRVTLLLNAQRNAKCLKASGANDFTIASQRQQMPHYIQVPTTASPEQSTLAVCVHIHPAIASE